MLTCQIAAEKRAHTLHTRSLTAELEGAYASVRKQAVLVAEKDAQLKSADEGKAELLLAHTRTVEAKEALITEIRGDLETATIALQEKTRELDDYQAKMEGDKLEQDLTAEISFRERERMEKNELLVDKDKAIEQLEDRILDLEHELKVRMLQLEEKDDEVEGLRNRHGEELEAVSQEVLDLETQLQMKAGELEDLGSK